VIAGSSRDEGVLSRERWSALSLAELASLFSRAEFPWWLAGGHAIEHVVGRTLRKHNDIDILVLRRDQAEVRDLLDGFECWIADPPGRLRLWAHGEILPRSAHDVWCRQRGSRSWSLQLLFDEADGEDWVSRRDVRVKRPINKLNCVGVYRIPTVVPEVQLFYKAKRPRPKDQIDFETTVPLLGNEQRAWLAKSISLAYGADHSWVGRLTGGGSA
jgi:hypothetical protein